MLCVNVYREDLKIHAARMKADPQRTRDLLGRHRATTEGIVNNLMNHRGVRIYFMGSGLTDQVKQDNMRTSPIHPSWSRPAMPSICLS